MQKNFGLFYKDKKDGKKYLYKSCYDLPEVYRTIETEDFLNLDKEEVFVVNLLENKVEDVKDKSEKEEKEEGEFHGKDKNKE